MKYSPAQTTPRSMEQKPGGQKYLNTVRGVIWWSPSKCWFQGCEVAGCNSWRLVGRTVGLETHFLTSHSNVPGAHVRVDLPLHARPPYPRQTMVWGCRDLWGSLSLQKSRCSRFPSLGHLISRTIPGGR